MKTDLVKRMTEAERDQTAPPTEPKDAATLILIDRAGETPKVLLGRRHHSHKFMPGKFVFPGGRVDAGDDAMPAANELHPAAEKKLRARVRDPKAAPPRAFALAAIRETFEETGLLLGEKRAQPAKSPGGLWDAFAAANVHPDLTQLHFIARAITPEGRPRRFDTRFFTADALSIAQRIDGVVGPDSELVELVWIPLPEAQTLDMPTITGVVLEELEARVKAGMGHDLAVPFYYMQDRQFMRELL